VSGEDPVRIPDELATAISSQVRRLLLLVTDLDQRREIVHATGICADCGGDLVDPRTGKTSHCHCTNDE
jgi:hypothetical protein